MSTPQKDTDTHDASIDGDATEPARAVGRPRDDSVDRKIIEAAVELYAERGWGKFSFDAVARRAGVGKPAIYLRYDSREELLVASFEKSYNPTTIFDTGSLRGDLKAFIVSQFEFWLSTIGNATLRMSADQIYLHDLGETYRTRVVRPMILAARDIVDRAKLREEISDAVDTNILLEAISGAVRTRVTDTRLSSRPRLHEIVDAYAEELLTMIL